MDQEQLQQNIVKYYNNLEKKLQEYFSSMIWMDEIKNIISKYKLNDTQTEILATETTLLLLGIIYIDDYKNTLQKELQLDTNNFDLIYNEIDNILINQRKETLTDAYNNHVNSLLDEKYGGDKKLDERFSSLPIEVQNAISESNYQTNLYNIAQKYKLSIEQMGVFEEVTNKVMLNIIHPDQYEVELNKTGIKKEDILELIKDVNEIILKNIREILKQNWDGEKKEEDFSFDINIILNEDIPIPPYKEMEIKKMEPVVSEIQNPLKTNDKISYQKNIIAEKIEGITVSGNTITDYSSNKKEEENRKETNIQTPIHDPYREVF